MEKENSVLKVLAGIAIGLVGYSAYKLIRNRGSLKELVESSPIKRKTVNGPFIDPTTKDGTSNIEGFTIMFEDVGYEITGTDVMMTARDFIVNVLKKDPEEIGIGEIVDGNPGAIMILNMEEPIDLHLMSMNKGPELATVRFEDVPAAKDAVTNKHKVDPRSDKIEFEFDGNTYVSKKSQVTADEFIKLIGLDPKKYGLAIGGGVKTDPLGSKAVINLLVIKSKTGPMYSIYSKDFNDPISKIGDEIREETKKEKGDMYEITVNGMKVESSEKYLTGIKIKRHAGVLEENYLWIKSTEQDILIHNTQSIDLEIYENAEFYTGECRNGVGIPEEETKTEKPKAKRGKKAEPRTIMINEEPVTWTMGKIKGMDIKRLVPEAIAKPHNYVVTQIFLRKPKIEIGDTDEIILWKKMKFKFEVKITGED